MNQPYQLKPPMRREEYEGLRRSMRERGYDGAHPVVVDEAGRILDGHHRATAAAELGIDYPTVELTGLTEEEKRLYAVENNALRRHLTDAQKVILGRRIEPTVAAQAHARRRAAQNNRAAGQFAAPAADSLSGRTDDLVAAAVGLGSGDTYRRKRRIVERVEREAPDLMPALEGGERGLADAQRELRRRAEAARRDERREEVADAWARVLGAQGRAAKEERRAYLEVRYLALSDWLRLDPEAVAAAALTHAGALPDDLGPIRRLADWFGRLLDELEGLEPERAAELGRRATPGYGNRQVTAVQSLLEMP